MPLVTTKAPAVRFVEVPEQLAWVNGFVEVGDEVFLPRAENSGRVELTQLAHSLGREDRIPYGTKVLHVSTHIRILRVDLKPVVTCPALQTPYIYTTSYY